ncbi:MAG: flagellar filament outer layer protein FlaA [Termitinemataceae bacterium]|nr:MAG: flagellar filament outer layer protein FlaA [Termitinemataceae bacterium]
MKRGSFVSVRMLRSDVNRLTVCFALLAIVSFGALPVFGDSSTVALESRILDKFDGSPYIIDNVEHHYTWKAVGSKFITKTDAQTFPIVTPVTAAPQALSRQNPEAKSLGLQGAFDRKGWNWIDIYPTESDGDNPVEIPLLGRTRFIDAWVWGSNLDYTLEAYIRDNRGIIHTVTLGSLRYQGWRNLRTAVPESLPMISNILPRSTHATTFVKLRVWTRPGERTFVDLERDQNGKIVKLIPFYIYISQLKVLSDVYETVYDGDLLAEPQKIEEIWSGVDTAAPPAGNN